MDCIRTLLLKNTPIDNGKNMHISNYWGANSIRVDIRQCESSKNREPKRCLGIAQGLHQGLIWKRIEIFFQKWRCGWSHLRLMCTITEPSTSVKWLGMQVFSCERSVMSARKFCRDQIIRSRYAMVKSYGVFIQAIRKKRIIIRYHVKKLNLPSEWRMKCQRKKLKAQIWLG